MIKLRRSRKGRGSEPRVGSDTINLTSPTTTDADRLMATLLWCRRSAAPLLSSKDPPLFNSPLLCRHHIIYLLPDAAFPAQYSTRSFLGRVERPNELASAMFRAKTAWVVGLGAFEMVRSALAHGLYTEGIFKYADLKGNADLLRRVDQTVQIAALRHSRAQCV